MRSQTISHTPSRALKTALPLVFVGAAASIYGVFASPDRTWPALLLNGFYAVSLALSAIFFLSTQRLTGARWSAGIRRIPEAFSQALPVSALLVLVLYFGREYLYSWSRPGGLAHEPAFAGKVQYLQTPWVFARMAVALVVWTFFAWKFRSASLQQDREPSLSLQLHHRLTRLAALFVLAFAVTFSMGAFDWLISLDPQWFSTMFAVYVFAGTFVQGIAAITLAVILLKERGQFDEVVEEQQLHDLGKMLFAFSTFWAYIWACQYLLIWYGNIPEEITHYARRTHGPWVYLFALNFVLNWVVPFLVLMSKAAKCKTKVLKIVCCLLLVGHWLDLYMVIMPSFSSTPRVGLLEIPIALGYMALLYVLFVRNLGRAALVPVNDPILQYERTRATLGAPMQHEFSGADK